MNKSRVDLGRGGTGSGCRTIKTFEMGLEAPVELNKQFDMELDSARKAVIELRSETLLSKPIS